MNNEENFQTNLYRLSDEVIDEISKAMVFYNKHSIIKNPILIERAGRDLSNVYTTVNNLETKEPVKNNLPDTDNALAKVNLQNTLEAFNQFLDKALQNAGEGQCHKLVLTIKNNYQSQVMQGLLK